MMSKAKCRCRQHHPLHTPAVRWIADEHRHPAQRRRQLPDGSLELTIPYAQPRELLMDIQRYGADAEVLAPPELRQQMRDTLMAALERYPKPE